MGGATEFVVRCVCGEVLVVWKIEPHDDGITFFVERCERCLEKNKPVYDKSTGIIHINIGEHLNV